MVRSYLVDLKLVVPHIQIEGGFARLYFPITEVERVNCFIFPDIANQGCERNS